MHRRFLLLPLAAVPAAAQAQEQPQPPQEIVVTGRGLGEGLGESVYDVATIDRDRLTGSAANRLEDVLADVAGFQNFRRSDARSANPTSQGATLRGLGGNASSRALLVLDGVPQTDPFGGWIYWPAYDPRRLGAVRVVRGGGSGVYGPGALAGTIELFSAGLGDSGGPHAELAYGSRDSVDAFASEGARLGTGFATVSAAYARGDGFIPTIAAQRGPVDRPSPYEQASIALRGVAPVSSDVELQANTLWFSDNRERGTKLTGNRTEGGDASLRLVGSGPWRWSALGYVQLRQYFNSFASVNAGRTTVSRSSEQYDVPSTGVGGWLEIRPPLGSGLELRLGSDWRAVAGTTNEFFNYANGDPSRVRHAGGRALTLGAFAEAAWKRGPWTVTAGGRIDRWSITRGHLVERQLATYAFLNDLHYPDRSGWEPTARGGVSLEAVPRLTLRTAAYLGWRLPTLNELYRPFRVGIDATAANSALKPERLSGFEGGADYRPFSGGRIGLTLFSNRLEDAIGNVTLGQGPGNFPGVGFVVAGGTYSARENLHAVASRGLEADGDLRMDQWSLAASVSHVDARVHAGGQAAALNDLRPAQTPRNMATGTLAWHGGGTAYGALTARYTGAQNEDDLGTQRLPPALTFDAAASLALTRRIAVEARAENLAGKRVAAGISGAGIVERAMPRTLWIGIKFGG